MRADTSNPSLALHIQRALVRHERYSARNVAQTMCLCTME
jgi:hypothetical protein